MSYVNPAKAVLAGAKRQNAKTKLVSSCLGCGVKYEKSVLWFQTQKFKCPACGGEIDKKPMTAMALEALGKLKQALKQRRI
jgi:peptide subunit release factor 1 (eRF1)